jgi:hypothetical protein
MPNEGDRVWVPRQTGEWVEATYVGPGEPGDAVDVPSPHGEGGFVQRDVGWVRFEDGTTARYPYAQMQDSPP